MNDKSIKKYIASLPKEMQIVALDTIKKEHERWNAGDFTEEEKNNQRRIERLRGSMSLTIEKIAVECINNFKKLSQVTYDKI